MTCLARRNSPVWRSFRIVTSHCATFCSGVLAHPHGLGVDTEHVLPTVYGSRNILAYILGKPGCQLTPDIELPTAYKVGQVFLAVFVQTMKQKILTVESESIGCYANRHYLKVGKLRDNTASGQVSEFIQRISSEILADSEYSDEICYDVAHKHKNSP